MADPAYRNGDVTLYHGDCLAILPRIPDQSVDCIICDPPYPCIVRPYGRMTEAEWHVLMRGVVTQCRRILKPSGSAVFILQPNSERVGRMRPWLWEFMAWTSREWNMVQDIYWWNPSVAPTIHCRRARGLCRPSVKPCVWLGAEDGYRNQDEILWTEAAGGRASDYEDRALRYTPSGQSVREGRIWATVDERGGVTPFNLLPISNGDSHNSAGAEGHGAGTPEPLCDWWVRYITPPGGVVCDPFMGTATTGRAAIKRGRRFIGIEQDAGYFVTAERRLAEAALDVERPHRPKPSRKDDLGPISGQLPLFQNLSD